MWCCVERIVYVGCVPIISIGVSHSSISAAIATTTTFAIVSRDIRGRKSGAFPLVATTTISLAFSRPFATIIGRSRVETAHIRSVLDELVVEWTPMTCVLPPSSSSSVALR